MASIEAADRARAPTCAHCGLPVPEAERDLGKKAEPQFCCAGCRTVYGLLAAHALTGYYRLRDVEGGERRAAQPSDRAYTELDDPEFLAQHSRTNPDGTVSCQLYLEGVHCAACVWLVEKLPHLAPGLVDARLQLTTGVVQLTYAPDAVRLSRLARLLDQLGYPPHPHSDDGRRLAQRRSERALLIRLAVAGAAFGNVMLMATALYSGLFSGIEAQYAHFFRWLSCLIAVPALLFSGSVFFKGAFAALRTRTPHMDLPVSIAVCVGLLWGMVNTVRGTGEVYFDTLTAVVFLLLVARWLQLRQQRRAADAASILQALTPKVARLWQDGSAVEVPLASLQKGQLIAVAAAEVVPVDGIVVFGCSAVDVSMLTGESAPLPVQMGDVVHAGTTNVAAPLRVRVETTGANTRLGQLVAATEALASRRAPVVELAHRLAGAFVLVVLGLALATFVGWLVAGAPLAVAADHAVALLIVTCPCALGMATPLAVRVAIGRAARAGVFIKGGDVVETLAATARVVLDKTGTLTRGQLMLQGFWGERAVQPRVRALEAQVNHPIARALVSQLPEERVTMSRLRHQLGSGLVAEVEGQSLVVGAPAFVLAAVNAPPPDWLDAALASCRTEGWTPVLVAQDGAVVAALALGDSLRDDTKAVLARLRSLGLELAIASGDEPEVVRAVGAALGLSSAACVGGLTPEAKLARIEASSREQVTMMVGDGVNDAAALVAANVGVAVHGGAEASLAAADVYLTKGGIAPLVTLVVGARRTLRLIKRNLALSLAYNVAGVVLAASGHLSPLLAAVLMPLSSLTVVTSSLRARTFVAEEP